MNRQLVELDRIHAARVFPWIHLFRAFRIALDVRKMILGALALVVLSGGLCAFSVLPLGLSKNTQTVLREWPWEFDGPVSFDKTSSEENGRVTVGIRGEEAARMLLRPVLSVWQPAMDLLAPDLDWPTAALSWTRLLWALAVWSFFGTAITRMAAVQFAVEERVGLREAVRFAGAKALWVFSSPLMPLAGVMGLWFLCLLGGWIGRIPTVGPVVVGVLWILPLFLALAMVLLLIGVVLGWPLMIATISTQGSDAFDGFSRSFDYVYSRPWHFSWFLLMAAAHGFLMLVFVVCVTQGIVHLAALSVSMGLGESAGLVLGSEGPPLFQSLEFAQAVPETTSFAGQAVMVWLYVVAMLVAGYGVSYFWTAATIIYFLLRQSADANHFSEVYLPKTNPSDELIQLAGVAASDQPVVERPPLHQPEDREAKS